MISSTARPTVTPDGTHELTRTWEAAEPKANVLIVHGIAEHSGRYEHVGGWLAERGFGVESFDLIGCEIPSGKYPDDNAGAGGGVDLFALEGIPDGFAGILPRPDRRET